MSQAKVHREYACEQVWLYTRYQGLTSHFAPPSLLQQIVSGGSAKDGQPLASNALTVIQGDVSRYDDVAKVILRNPLKSVLQFVPGEAFPAQYYSLSCRACAFEVRVFESSC